MGKIVRYNKPALSLVIFLALLFLTPVHSYASYREYDLLQKGYESYLSYQPEKAAEEFNTFLQEFPHSSARDAALFWFGKSLMQTRSTDEAGRVFIELKQQFPDSPFVAFIVTQSESGEREASSHRTEPELVPQAGVPESIIDTEQPEPAPKMDDAIIEPTMSMDIAATTETPAEQEAAAVPYQAESIQQQMSELQAPIKSETADVRSAGDQEPILSESGTTPTVGMIAKGEEPEATQSEVIKTGSNETEIKEPALQKSEVIESAAEPPPDVALPEMALPDATPEPENIKAPETVVAITKVGEQETASPQPDVSSGQAPDIMKKVEGTEGKEPEVKEPVVKAPEVKEPEVKEPEVKEAEVEEVEVKEVEVQEPEDEEPGVKGPAPSQEYQGTGEETGKQADEENKELSTPKEEQAQSDQTVLNKVGIQGALWSTGDRSQDFIDEQILYNEAVKLDLSIDEDELRELRERYTLGIEEVDYLKRFLLICKLIDKKTKEMPGDKIVEVISVRYKDAGQREQPELAAELRALANKGVTFEEISRSYPDIVHFKTIALQELPEWIQERIQGLQNYEVGVIWSEEGYMILKPIIQIYSYDPFEELSSQEREKITAYIRSWIAELKGASQR